MTEDKECEDCGDYVASKLGDEVEIPTELTKGESK